MAMWPRPWRKSRADSWYPRPSLLQNWLFPRQSATVVPLPPEAVDDAWRDGAPSDLKVHIQADEGHDACKKGSVRVSVLTRRSTDECSDPGVAKRPWYRLSPAATAFVLKVLGSKQYQILILVVVLYSLLITDVLVACSVRDAMTPYVDSSLVLVAALFAAEAAANVLVRPRRAAVLVLLDCVTAASVLVDVQWVARSAGLYGPDGRVSNPAGLIAARGGRLLRLVRVLTALGAVAAVWTLARAWARWREELAERKKKKTGAGERSLRLLSDGGAQRDGQERNGHSVPVFVGKETSQASGLSPTVPSDSLVEASGRSPLVSKPEPKPAEPGWSGPSADIGMELIDTTTLQVATLLVLAMVGTALLTPAARLASLPDPFRAVLAALDLRARELPSGDCAGLQGLVDVLLRVGASSSVLGDQLPVALLVGPTCEWTWIGDERAESRRSSDRLVLEWGEAWLELNIARQHRAAALRDLGLMAAMLGALLCFSTLINLTVYRVLLAPLERIFSTLRSQAAQILSALPAQEGGDGQPGADRDRGVATIEAAVEKMARLVAHVNAGGGGQGAHIASGLMLSADAAARDWLAAATGIKGKGGGRIEEDEDDEFGAEGGRDLYDGLAEPQATSASAQSLSPVQGRNVSSAQEEGWAPAQPSTPPQAPSPTASAASGEAAAPGPWPEQTPLQDWQVDALAAALQLLHASPLHSGADVCAFDVLTLPAEMLVPFGCALFLWRGLVRDAEVEDKVPALRDAASWQHRGALLNPTSPSSHLSISPSLAPSSNPPASKPSRLTSWVPTSQLWRFVEALEARYRANPYHNFRHALDVAATCAGLCLRVAAFAGLAPADERALLLAALAHDLEHPGVNNAFLVQAREALARTYNDASVLENRHAAALFDLLAQRPDADVLGRLPPKSWRATRAAVIAAILHTDMIHHFPMVSQLEVFCELHGAQLTSVYQQAAADAGSLRRSSEAGAAMFSSAENRQFLLNVLLHAADISNAAKPISLGVPWSDRVLAESFAQGEQERARGWPLSPLCDSAATSRAGSQINFIELLVAPLYAQLARLLPQLADLLAGLCAAREHWQGQLLHELAAGKGPFSALTPAQRLQEQGRAQARWAAFRERYRARPRKESAAAAAAAPAVRAARISRMSGPGGRVSRLFNGSARSSEGLGPESSEESRAEGSAKSEHGLLGAAGQEEGAAMPKPKVSFVEAKAGGARRTSGMLNAKPQRMSLLGTRNSLFIPPPVSEESLADENGMV